jgi:polyhydroxybutyrate depolymerase
LVSEEELTPVLTRHAIQFGAATRSVLVAAPSADPVAIVLSLHGSGSTPERQAQLSRMTSLADAGVLVAFPQGSLPRRSGREWDLEADVAFVDAVVDYLLEKFHLKGVPLCLSGMSGGARMASRFSASGRHPVQVLGAVAGLRDPAVDRLGSPVRVLAFHGTRDRMNPYAGGNTTRWNESVLDAAAAWARANGHSSDPDRTEITDAVTRLSYGAQDDPNSVTLWVCAGAGHTWPGTRLPLFIRLFLGRVSYDVDATTEIFRALQQRAQHPRAG